MRIATRPEARWAYFLKAVIDSNVDLTETPTEFTAHTWPRDLQGVISRRGATLAEDERKTINLRFAKLER